MEELLARLVGLGCFLIFVGTEIERCKLRAWQRKHMDELRAQYEWLSQRQRQMKPLEEYVQSMLEDFSKERERLEAREHTADTGTGD